jgi:CxxC motif-containing protein (DUF1111 family)
MCLGWRRCVWVLGTIVLAAMIVASVLTAPAPVLSGGVLPPQSDSSDLATRGETLFRTNFTPEQGLGPLYNRTSCLGCHVAPTIGGVGPEGLGTATRVGRLTPAGFDALIGHGGPIARTHSVAESGLPCDLSAGIPEGANVTSVRNAPDLHGTGLIDQIPDSEIAAGAVVHRDGIHGRAHWVRTADGKLRIGRFGWKADTATLRQFVAEAFRNELGITSPLAPVDFARGGRTSQHRCPGEGDTVEGDETIIDAVTAFVAQLPAPTAGTAIPQGQALFDTIGCSSCHKPYLNSGKQQVWLYSDLLLHDLGPDLDDRVVQNHARGRDWRTAPLWGLSTRPRLLHDARAHTFSEAILSHGGEATAARRRFRQLSPVERDTLLAFLTRL